MIKQAWIPLADYSQKYHVSVSTLRRRIKNAQVEFIYSEGRYQLKDLPLDNHNPMPANRPQDDHIASPQNEAICHMGAVADNFYPTKIGFSNSHLSELPSEVGSESAFRIESDKLQEEEKNDTNKSMGERTIMSASSDSSVLNTANLMLSELKTAYINALQNKEEQIMGLKGEVTDLKTLVRVLESEIGRLKLQMSEAAPIDSWLESINSIE